MSSSDRLDPIGARAGYGLVAGQYETWKWVEFWRRNERPLVERWLRSLTPALGLDAGAGTGSYSELAARSHHTPVEVDISIEMLKAKRSTGGVYRRRVQADLVCLPFGTGSFGWTLCSRVLTHLPNPEAAISELARTLRPGSELLITDVHPSLPYENVHVVTATRQVRIRAFKHEPSMIQELARRHRLKELGFHVFSPADLLWKASPEAFPGIYSNGTTHVWYALRMQRQ